jgi:hypothetical protein
VPDQFGPRAERVARGFRSSLLVARFDDDDAPPFESARTRLRSREGVRATQRQPRVSRRARIDRVRAPRTERRANKQNEPLPLLRAASLGAREARLEDFAKRLRVCRERRPALKGRFERLRDANGTRERAHRGAHQSAGIVRVRERDVTRAR